MKSRRGNAGFTIYELLVVITLMSVLTTMGVTMLFKISGAWNVSRDYTYLSGLSDDAFESLARDFNHVLSQKRSGVPLRGGQNAFVVDNPDSPFHRVTLENDHLVLPVQELDQASGVTQTQSVMYSIDRSGEAPALVRAVGPLGEAAPASASQAWPGVYAFRVEFFDGAGWQPQWEQDALPESVRVSLVIVDQDHSDEQIARRATFPIHVD